MSRSIIRRFSRLAAAAIVFSFTGSINVSAHVRVASSTTRPAVLEGTFVGPGITVQLRLDASQDRFIGTLTENGVSVPVELARTGVGLYATGAVPRPVSLTGVGASYTLTRGRVRTTLRRLESVDGQRAFAELTGKVANAFETRRGPFGGPAAPHLNVGAPETNFAGSIEFPGLPGPVAVPGPAPIPTAATVPPFVRVGTRLTYQLGSSSAPVAGSKDGPTGAQSYQQVTITGVVNAIAATEVRSFAVDLTARAVWSAKTETYLFPVDAGGEFWSSPQKLAAMPSGTSGGVTTTRLDYPLDGKTYKAIRITTPNNGGNTQYTYDLDTGMLLIWGTESVGANGTRHLGQSRFVSMRQTALPWAGQTAGASITGLSSADWSGTYSVAVDNAYTATYRLSQRWDVTRADALAVQVRETMRLDMSTGGAPQVSTSVRTFPTAGLWIDPTILAGLRKGQMIDNDPVTGLRTSVLGSQNGMLIIGEQGTIQSSAAGFDLRTGLLSAVQTQTRNAPGTTTVFLQRKV
jgi:hypothetical protein